MAVSVEIINQSMDKELSLKSIVGDNLVIGSYDDNWRFQSGKAGDNMAVFDPTRPGRSIGIKLNPKDRYKITAYLNFPAAEHDVELFVEVVKRVATDWGAVIKNPENEYMPPEVFAANENKIKDFNIDSLKQAAQNILDGKADSFCVFAAFWPLYMGKDESQKFITDPSDFDEWLRSKQDTDAFYSGVSFYKNDEGIMGSYAIVSDTEYVFPKKPRIPFGLGVDGKPLECSNFKVALGNEKEMLGILDFDEFLKKLPKDKVSDYDLNDILIGPFTEEEIKAFL